MAKNDFARRIRQQCNIDLMKGFQVGKSIALTQCMDMALITLHEDFGFGAVRIKRFYDAFNENWNEVTEIAKEDTPDREYVKDIIDRRLKCAVPPDEFRAWNDRYEYDFDPKTDYKIKERSKHNAEN